MKLLSERLKLAMSEKSRRDGAEVIAAGIARAARTSDTSVSFWLNDTNGISAAKARLIAEYLGVNALWLENGSGPMRTDSQDPSISAATTIPSQNKSSSIEIEIPQYKDVGGSMGLGVVLRDQPGEIHGWRVTSDWVSKNVKHHSGVGNLAIVTGFGDSMRPLFNPGDPLLVDSGVKAVEFDSIYFFRIGDEGFIKRLQRVPGEGLMAISENKAYRDWAITPEMDFEVFARVIKVWCGTDF